MATLKVHKLNGDYSTLCVEYSLNKPEHRVSVDRSGVLSITHQEGSVRFNSGSWYSYGLDDSSYEKETHAER